MIKLSRRMLEVKSSPTLVLNAKAKTLAKQGIKVFNFSVGEPDFGTPKAIVDQAIASLNAGRTKYGPAGGSPELREAITAKLQRDNSLSFPAEDVVVGMGAKEILFHLFLALINDGDEVLVPAPFWVSYPDQIIAAGGKPVLLPVPEDPGHSPISIETIKRYATDRTVGIVLNSPNNPAGYVLSKQALTELGEFLCTKPNWWIISDEIYEYMAFDKPHISLLQLFPQLKERFFLVNGMSKGFSMTGWRVGYAVGPKEPMKIVRDLQSHSSTCVPPFIEDAVIFALREGSKLLSKEIGTLRQRRDLCVSILKNIAGVELAPPEGAFYAFLDLRKALKHSKTFANNNTFAFSERLLSHYHVAAVPGEAFGAPGFLRVSYATSEETIKEGFVELEKALREL